MCVFLKPSSSLAIFQSNSEHTVSSLRCKTWCSYQGLLISFFVVIWQLQEHLLKGDSFLLWIDLHLCQELHKLEWICFSVLCSVPVLHFLVNCFCYYSLRIRFNIKQEDSSHFIIFKDYCNISKAITRSLFSELIRNSSKTFAEMNIDFRRMCGCMTHLIREYHILLISQNVDFYHWHYANFLREECLRQGLSV